MKGLIWTIFLFFLLLCGTFCSSGSGSAADEIETTEAGIEAVQTPSVDEDSTLFTPLRNEVGIEFEHYNAATEERWLPETMGSGVAFFDYDNDQYPDLYFLNGAPLLEDRSHSPTGRLYHNLGNGEFEDVTEGSGLDESYFAWDRNRFSSASAHNTVRALSQLTLAESFLEHKEEAVAITKRLLQL